MSANDIVISGMGGRLPLSDTIDEFASNLFAGVDMVTEDDSRWPKELFGICYRMGKLHNLDRFDGNFFGLMGQMVDGCDPQSRLLLETTYEAIVDAGINPQSLGGTRTGVYIGVSSYPFTDGLPEYLEPDLNTSKQMTTLTLLNMKCLYANRISFVFNFKGPSLITDTACSASLTAFNLAMNDLRLGNVDYAIVGGTHLTPQPHVLHIQMEGGICSPRGIPAVCDQSADGFVKGEGVACVLLQKRSTARRVYGTVITSRLNIDGRKTVGMFCPLSAAQVDLMVTAYKEANVDPAKLTFIEGHLTGTRVGDPQEMNSIYQAYCAPIGRTELLPLGLLKSNMGHGEAASGVSAIIKVLIAYENEMIPKNIHLTQIKDEIKKFCPPLYPNTENLKYTPGLAAVNNSGIGGVNAHVLLEPNYKLMDDNSLLIAENIPRIVNICGRTEFAINSWFEFFEKNPHKISRDFLAILGETMKQTPDINSAGFPYRGSVIMKKLSENNNEIKYEYKKQFSRLIDKSLRPIWFLFPGLGGQWSAMAKALMPIDIFRNKVEECHQILSEFGVDLKHMLLSEDKRSMSTMTAKFCSTTAIEIALFDVLTELNITPDGIIGHSFGEIACAYADGCLTTREAMAVTYFRGEVTENDPKIPKGLMAVVGLGKSEALKICPKGVYVVCINAKKSTVISGPIEQMKEVISSLEETGVFVRQLHSNDIPYHSEYLKTSAKPMIEKIKRYITEPKRRSDKWISTSVVNQDCDKEELASASAEYFVHNLMNPVHFYEQFKRLPSDAIVVELSAHTVFGKIVTETLESSTYISLLRKDSNDTNLDLFLTSLAKLYELGVNPAIERLYPRVEWPVCRSTQSIGSLVKWDHSVSYSMPKYPDHYNRNSASDMNVVIDFTQKEDQFYADHSVDGNVIFPATGYLMLAWRRFAASVGRVWNQVPVVFENIQLKRAVFLSETNITKLKVKIFESTGEFNVLENGNVCCVGRIYSPSEDVLLAQSIIAENDSPALEYEYSLDREDIYKELRVMGLDYGNEFQCLRKIRTNDYKHIMATNEWTGNFVTFLDAMLQSMAFVAPFRKLMVPVMIRSLRVDPKVFFDNTMRYKIAEVAVDENGEPVPVREDVVIEEELKETEEKLEKEYSEIQEAQAYAQEFFDIKDEAHRQLEAMAHRFHKYRSLMPVHFDATSKLLVTYGIEVENILAFPIPRKVDTQDLVLDSYEFVANDDDNAIEVCDRKRITDYIEVCKSMAIKAKAMVYKEMKCDFNNTDIDNDVINGYRNNGNSEHQVLFRALDKMLSAAMDENENINTLTDEEIQSIIADIENSPDYDMSKDLIVKDIAKNERLIRSVVDIVAENLVPLKEVKVMEINLGAYTMAKEIVKYMSTFAIYPIDVDYKLVVKSMASVADTDRDISANVTIWTGDEPLVLHPSHLVVVNCTEDLWRMKTGVEELIQDVFDSLIDTGFLIAVFRYKFTEPELALRSLSAGNVCLSDAYLERRVADFTALSTKCGFAVVAKKCDSIASMAILFRKVDKALPKMPTKKQMIRVDSSGYERWFHVLQDKLLEMKDLDNKADTVWLLADDSSVNGIVGLINCLRLEPGGERLRCVFNYDAISGHTIDVNTETFAEIVANDLVVNVWKDQRLGTYRHIKLARDCDKTVSSDYFLNLGQTRDLSSLQWFDAKNIASNEDMHDFNNNKVTQIPIHIYSSGLTFHDVMVATGRIPSGPQLLFTDCLIGCEFAGRRSDTGVRVMGFEMTRCFATSIYANELMISDIPDHWSMNDAVSVLSTYSTAWYALISRGNLQKNEKVLIHSGAGGVGQAAINICKHYNCDIFVTVGTEEKRHFLATEFGIPSNRIFNSRDTQFKYRVMAETSGKGVDVVLNSLAGEKLDASYECVANGGRFLELGKFDLAQNKKLGMFDFLRDVSFVGVAVDICLMERRYFAHEFFVWMHANCTNGCVKPINCTVFPAQEAEKAFRYMTTGKHIGKIIVKMRDEEDRDVREREVVIKPALEMNVNCKTYFDASKVYIITGGLGGFGLELVHWMLYMGAKRLVLTSRTGIKTDYQKYVLNRLKAFGKQYKCFESQIHVSTADCFTLEGAQQLLTEAKQLGATIGGVFHLALELNDCLLEKLTYEKFCSSIDTKHKIFAHLDQLTRALAYSLDYFVVFSSVTCGKGNGGQSNYSYGNSMCERICEQRRRDGLHGLAIQYGPVGDVGVFEKTDQLIKFLTMQKQRINSCCEVLDRLLTVKQPIVTSFVKSDNIKQTGSRQKRMVRELWKALGIDPEATPDHLTLGEIGMESMFAVELQQELEREWNIKVSLNHVKNITVKMLKDYEAGRVDNVRQYIDDLKKARAQLLRYRFIIPEPTHSRLNAVTNGRPVFFMPPMEVTFSVMEDVAKRIDRPVIGLNWTRNVSKMTTMKELMKYYLHLLSTLAPNGDCDIVGYFEGAVVCAKALAKGRARKAVIVDILNDCRFRDEFVSDEFILEFMFSALSQDVPESFLAKLARDMKCEPDLKAKINKMTSELRDFAGKGLVATDLDEISHLIIKRAHMLSDYRFAKRHRYSDRLKHRLAKKWAKYTGKLMFIKPFDFSLVDDHDDHLDKARELYLLPEGKEFDDKIAVQSVDYQKTCTLSTDVIIERIVESLK